MGRCESQQPDEQNTSLILPELHVETEQRITLAPTAIGLRHMEQTKAGVVVISPTIYHVSEGVDYHRTIVAHTPAGGQKKARPKMGKIFSRAYPGAASAPVGSRCYLSAIARASALASVLASSGMRMP